MEQNEQINGSAISLIDLVKALLGKIKLIICITILAAIIGGVYSMFNISYGGMVSFYVDPYDETDSLLFELDSTRFAERLLLDKNGLPEKALCDPEDYQAALDAVNAANAINAQRIECAKKMHIFKIEHNYNKKHAQLVEKVTMLQTLIESYNPDYPSETVSDPDRIAIIAEYDKKLAAAVEELEAFEEGPQKELESMEIEKKLLDEYWHDALDEADAAKEIVLAEWRKDSAEKINAVKNSLVYEYSAMDWVLEKSDNMNNEEQAASLSKSFINIHISAGDNEKLAKEILDGLKEIFPIFVKEFMMEKNDEIEPECELMSTVSVASEKSGFLGSGTVKSAVAFAGIGFAVSAVAVLAVYAATEAGILSKSERKSKVKKNDKSTDQKE